MNRSTPTDWKTTVSILTHVATHSDPDTDQQALLDHATTFVFDDDLARKDGIPIRTLERMLPAQTRQLIQSARTVVAYPTPATVWLYLGTCRTFRPAPAPIPAEAVDLLRGNRPFMHELSRLQDYAATLN
jgi:hypothetical protein